MPDAHHHENVLDTHLLQQMEQFLAHAIFSIIIVVLDKNSLIGLLIDLVDSVGEYLVLSLFESLLFVQVLDDQWHLELTADRC